MMKATTEKYKNCSVTTRVVLDGKTIGFIDDLSSLSSNYNFMAIHHSGSERCNYPRSAPSHGFLTFDEAVDCIVKCYQDVSALEVY